MKRKTRGAALVAALIGMVLSLALVRPAAAADGRPGRIVFPDVTLTTQDGDDVKFYDLIKGRVVAIDLIYTTCQYACPLESARLARMQQLLGDRMGKDIFFISISIDPEHDTPAALKAYAAKYQAGPGWIFLTGKQGDIDMLSKKLGLWTDPSLSQDGHTPMLLIGNEATGQWTQTSALDNPKYTAVMIEQWMGGSYKPGKSYTEAKPIANGSDVGAYDFKSFCSNCHTIGGGDKIGPDLAVAFDSRDPQWLAEYSLRPDAMRQRNDPIATMLAEKYPHVRMPNLGLTPTEVKAIMQYVAIQKSHVTASGGDSAAAPAAPRASEPSPASASSPASALIAPAVAIQSALAGDTMVGVGAQAKALRDAAAALGAPGAAIAAAAGALSGQTTIAEARTAFGTTSDALVAYIKANRSALGGDARIAYCPMLRKSWIQKDGPIENPYYGSRMLACGELTN
jgi:protein SCO1/2